MARALAPANGNVLRWARNSRGLTIPEAAKRLRITEAELTAIEEGRELPTIGIFSRMADVYQRPQGFLLAENVPTEPITPPDRRTLANRPTGFTTASLSAMREARRFQAFIAGLLTHERELFPSNRITEPKGGFPDVENLESAESIAASERQRFGVSSAVQNIAGSPRKVFQGWRLKLNEIGVIVLIRRFPIDDCRGFSFYDSKMPPVIVVSSADSDAGNGFTLLHEYGHLILKQSGACIPGSVQSRRLAVEQWCTRFSAAFLMPHKDVVLLVSNKMRNGAQVWTERDVHMIALYFRVSDFAAALRVKELKLGNVDAVLDHFYASDKKKSGGGGGGGETRAVKRVRENGYGAIAPILGAVGANVIDHGQAAEALRIEVTMLPNLRLLADAQKRDQSFVL